MKAKQALMNLLDPQAEHAGTPAAFFIHFSAEYLRGQAAVEQHLAFFEHTGMDVLKVQYEDRFPHRPQIRGARDWAAMPVYGLDFYANQLEILEAIIAAAPKGVPVIQTMYSPFMQAGTTASRDLLRAHIREDPGAVRAGMERITESMLAFVRECVRLGVDGFYASSQGGDVSMFAGSPLFEECVKPYDLALMREMDRSCRCNILHICDFHSGYEDLAAFTDYPGHVVSVPGSVEVHGANWARDADRFNRPLMGGLDRHGIIATGSDEAIAAAVKRVLDCAPRKLFLGADCTLPGDVSWDNIRTAVAAAHEA